MLFASFNDAWIVFDFLDKSFELPAGRKGVGPIDQQV